MSHLLSHDVEPAPEAVIDFCRRVVRERRYALHPFVTELDRIQPDRAALGRWAAQKYHQVYRQNVIWSWIHANAQDDIEVRGYALDQLLAEETGVVSGDAPHYTLMRRFAEACGARPEDFDAPACSTQVASYVARLVGLCRRPQVAVSLLVIYAIEAQSGEAASRLADWLAANRGFTAEELSWFAVHAHDEDDHAADALSLARRLGAATPEFASRSISAVEEITSAWLRLQDYYSSLLEGR